MVVGSLAVIDGWFGMEGNGPVDGTPVEMGLALANTDFVAADALGASLMGFDPSEVGYMTYARGRLGEGDLSKIRVVGEEPSLFRKKFRPHRDSARAEEVAGSPSDVEQTACRLDTSCCRLRHLLHARASHSLGPLSSALGSWPT